MEEEQSLRGKLDPHVSNLPKKRRRNGETEVALQEEHEEEAGPSQEIQTNASEDASPTHSTGPNEEVLVAAEVVNSGGTGDPSGILPLPNESPKKYSGTPQHLLDILEFLKTDNLATPSKVFQSPEESSPDVSGGSGTSVITSTSQSSPLISVSSNLSLRELLKLPRKPILPPPPPGQVNSAASAAQNELPPSANLQASNRQSSSSELSSQRHPGSQAYSPPENLNKESIPSEPISSQNGQQSIKLRRSLLHHLQTIKQSHSGCAKADPILVSLAQQFFKKFEKPLTHERFKYMTKDIVGLNHDTWVQAVIFVMAAVSSQTDCWTPYECFDQLMCSAKWILGGAVHVDLQEVTYARLTQLEVEFFPPHDLFGSEEAAKGESTGRRSPVTICPANFVFCDQKWEALTLSIIKLAYSDPQKVLDVHKRLQKLAFLL